MSKLFAASLLAIGIATTVATDASAQSVRVETGRVCRDSDGDRVPCGRRYYRERDGDRDGYRNRNRDNDGVGVSIGVGRRGGVGVRVDTDD